MAINPVSSPTLDDWRQLVFPRRNAQAIFWRGGWGASHVNLRRVEVVDFALLADLEPLPTRGLVADWRLYRTSIVSRWSEFEHVDGNWANKQEPWKLFFDTEILDAVHRIMVNLPPGKNFIDDVYTEPITTGAPVPRYRRSSPGPVFQSLIDYLRESELRLFGWTNDDVDASRI